MQKLAAAYKRVLALVFVGVFTSTVGQLAAHVSELFNTKVGELWPSVLKPLGQVFFAAATAAARTAKTRP